MYMYLSESEMFYKYFSPDSFTYLNDFLQNLNPVFASN